MAKSTSKSKGGSALGIRRVTNKKERQTGGFFKSLKTDEWLKGYALFTPDPEAADNDGYFEYFEHWDNDGKKFVPCAGEDDCYLCELGESPSVRASTMWYFPDEDKDQRIKIFKLNGYLIRDFAEIDAEEGGVLGKRFRVKRLSDKGEYRVSPQTDKPLTKKEIKAILKEAKEKKMDLEALLLAQMKKAIATHDAVGAMTEQDDDEDDDDDGDDEDEKPKARRGKEKKDEKKSKSKKDEDEDEDDDSDDDDDDDESDADDDENDDDSDDDDSDDDDDDENDDDDSDDDDDESDDDDDDESDDDEDEAEAEKLTGQKFTVEGANEGDETVTVKIDGKKVKLWFGEGVEWDDAIKKGAEITTDLEKDAEGDWVVTKLKVKKAKAKK